MSVKDIIESTDKKSFTEFEKNLHEELEDRVSRILDEKKLGVSKSLFQKEDIENLGETLSLEEEELLVSLVEAFVNASDEEKEDFLQSEEFEQLDELSKNTLLKYIDTEKRS